MQYLVSQFFSITFFKIFLNLPVKCHFQGIFNSQGTTGDKKGVGHVIGYSHSSKRIDKMSHFLGIYVGVGRLVYCCSAEMINKLRVTGQPVMIHSQRIGREKSKKVKEIFTGG